MTVIISNGATALSTVNGFYRVEAYNMGMFSTTDLALTSTRTIAFTPANAGNCQGVVLALNTTTATIDRSVVVELQQAPLWGVVATVTLTAATITNSVTNKTADAWIVPFTGGTFPFAVTAVAATWRFQVYQTGGTTGTWNIRTSDATNPFYATWCDNAVSFNTNDCVIAKDVVTIDQTATFRGVLGTGDTTRSVCAVACRSTTPTPANVAQFLWSNPPAAAYTLTIDGLMVLSAHSAFRAGTTGAGAIPVANAATITIQQVPTAGSAGISGFTDAEYSSTSSTRKASLFLYGAIPTYERSTLNADAATGQPDIVTVDDLSAQWANGDSVYVGRQNTQGAGDTTARTINNIVGTTITLSSNLSSANRLTGGHVIRMNGYGITLQSSTTTAVTNYLKGVSNFEISGCRLTNVTFVLVNSEETSLDDAANRQAMIITHSSTFFTTSNRILQRAEANENGLTISYINGFQSNFCSSLVRGSSSSTGISGAVIVSDCVFLTAASATVVTLPWTISDNFYENGSASFLTMSGAGATLQDNLFWGNSASTGAVAVAAFINSTSSGNAIDRNAVGFCFFSSPSIGSIFTDEVFGGISANTTDIGFSTGPYVYCEFVSPAGLTTIDTTALLTTIVGTNLRISEFNGTANDDRGYTPYGYFQRVGDGLADTTRHTVGAGLFALRMQPTTSDSSAPFEWEFVVPTGDITGLTMTVACWVKINNLAYYGGTHRNPRLVVDYDNGTVLTTTAADSTAWQLLAVNFVPATAFGQITVTVDGYTDATGTNAYFYIDDFAVLYPAGYVLNLGGMDLFAHAMPVVPPIATTISAMDVWTAQTSVLTAAGSIGKLLTDDIDATISSRLAAAGYTTPPTVVAIRQEMDANSVDLDAIIGYVDDLETRLTAARALLLDNLVNLDATVSSRAPSATALSTANWTNARALLIDNLVNLDATITGIPADMLAEVVEGAYTYAEILRLMSSALFGRSAGGGTPNVAFRDLANTKNRIAATVAAGGNRTGVALDGT